MVGDVDNLDVGVYRYKPGPYRYKSADHSLVRVLEGDYRPQLTMANLGQYFVEGGAIHILFAAVYSRISVRAGDEGAKFVHMEAGHAAQNVYLQAEALGLGTVVIGGFDADRTQDILKLPPSQTALYFMTVGRR